VLHAELIVIVPTFMHIITYYLHDTTCILSAAVLSHNTSCTCIVHLPKRNNQSIDKLIFQPGLVH